jgi:nuclear cap-binding protein subunit 1
MYAQLIKVIEKYLELLQQFNISPESRLQTVQNVASFWKNNSQFMEIILDKLVNYRIVDPKSIILHFVSKDVMQADYSRFYLASILKNTLVKVNLKAQQIEISLEKAKTEHDTSIGTTHLI